ncbi:hypothetical protein GcC1_045034 [Golovinomyces cichoracearum]|uniref:Uncharacterized protein n=1 Tax=Golovinomyces cichoracearum TaxID=62708 RepID=A0A420IYH5_9PEZI|nr:hypothetical protein GcC1_045034 [Golovinomyces cichoracearum]
MIARTSKDLKTKRTNTEEGIFADGTYVVVKIPILIDSMSERKVFGACNTAGIIR